MKPDVGNGCPYPAREIPPQTKLHPMKVRILFSLLLAALILGGCATTPTARIARNRAAYESWTPDVQREVAAGRIAPGYTVEQVQIALGEPDRRVQRTTAEGVSELWYYTEHRPRFGFGFGLASFGGSSAVGASVGVNDMAFRPDERTRVTFREGRVDAIETSQR